MWKKLFLVAAVCASFVQVWGTPELEENKKKAIEELKKIMFDAYWNTNDFSLYTGFTLADYEVKTEKHLEEATTESQNLRELLSDTSVFLKNEAKATNKPQSVFICIDKVLETSIEKIERVTTKHKTDIQVEHLGFQKNVKNILSDSKKLYTAVCYERAASEERIQNSTQISDVKGAVFYYTKLWKPVIYIALEKMRDDRSLVVKTYDPKIDRYLLDYREKMASIRSDSPHEMQQCLYPKQNTSGKLEKFGKLPFLNLINAQ